VNEGIDLSFGLTPDLLAQRVIARDAVPVLELVGPVGVRLLAQPAGGLDHVQDQSLGGAASLARDESQLRTQRRHVIPLLGAERIGGDDPETVAFGGADQRERCPRAATRVLDDRVSGLQSTILFRPRDDGLRHPVLHAAGRILRLELHENLGAARWNDLAKSNHRCVSYYVENVHGLSSSLCWLVQLRATPFRCRVLHILASFGGSRVRAEQGARGEDTELPAGQHAPPPGAGNNGLALVSFHAHGETSRPIRVMVGTDRA